MANLTAGDVLNFAAKMVQAVMGSGPSGITIPTSGSTFDQATIQRNLYANEILKVWVNQAKAILTDPTDWPLPTDTVGGLAHGGANVPTTPPATPTAPVTPGTAGS